MLDAKQKLIKKKTLGQDQRVDAIINETDPALVALYEKALVINKSDLKRGYVESALLAETDLQKISDLLEVPMDVLYVYEEIFFHVLNLDKLSKLEHIESVDDPQERQLKLWTLGQGLNFLSWRMGNKVNLSPIDGLQEMYSMASWKAKEAVYSSNASESSREAIKWTKMATDLARLLKVFVMDSGAARTELAIAIQEVVPDFIGLDSLLEENRVS